MIFTSENRFGSFSRATSGFVGLGKFAAGISNPVNPVYAPLGLRSKGPLGAYSRATRGTVIEGGKSLLVWDKERNDPYARRGS